MALTTQHGTKTVQDFVDLFKHKRLNLAPAFQRQSVWSLTDRRLLLISLFEGVPLPAVYLYRQIGTGGKPLLDVIDGKQRLETILLFLGLGPLTDGSELSVRTSLEDGAPAESWTWRTLGKPHRNSFLNAKIPVIEVDGELSDIITLFVRINATGKRLTAQERRHAHYHNSPVLKVAQRLADEQTAFLLRNHILAQSQIQRMKHVELMSELMLAANAGAPLHKKQKIDELIRGQGISLDEANQASTHVQRSLRVVEAVLPHLRTTRFRQLADFYSLVLLLHLYWQEGRAITAQYSARNALAADLLTDFGRGVDEVSEKIAKGRGVTPLEEPFRVYLTTVKEGTDSKKQRETRQRLLRDVLDGVFDHLDTTRTFNTTQRRILWHASANKKCSLCGESIKRWEDLAIDHVHPHIKGGRTDLANAALTHRSCNLSKGAR